MRILDLPQTEWAETLRRRQAFVDGTQHDHLYADWDGAARQIDASYMVERWAEKGGASDSVPYSGRRPDASYPLPKQVVRRFTEMLLGLARRPRIRVRSDLATERCLHAIFGESESWDALIETRDRAGGCGAGALSIGINNGEPIARSHDPADLLVLAWKARARFEPEHVIEQRLVTTRVLDKDGKVAIEDMWETIEWTTEKVIRYKPVPKDVDRDTDLEVDDEKEHGCKGVPMVWLPNTRCTTSPVGEPDCAGAEHLFDKMDRCQSQTVKAAIANCDPTPVVKRKRHPRSRDYTLGSGNAIALGIDEEMSYLEMAGTSVDWGWRTVERLRDEALQTVGCVLVDPTTAGKGQSGEALEKLWRSMEARIDRLRVTLQRAIIELCMKWLSLGEKWGIGRNDVAEPEGGLLLPPHVVHEDTPEQEGEVQLEAHQVGNGRHIETIWPPHHTPTPQQISHMAQGLNVATGGKATISQETASAHMASALGQEDPAAELRRIESEGTAQRDETLAGQFGPLLEDEEEEEEEEEFGEAAE